MFVTNEIGVLLKTGRIAETENPPKFGDPLTVAYNKSDKPRLVLHCRHLNQHMFKFKYTGMGIRRWCISEGG